MSASGVRSFVPLANSRETFFFFFFFSLFPSTDSRTRIAASKVFHGSMGLD